MKKSKIVLSTLAAAVFATSAGALVACGDGVELPEGLEGLAGKTYTITFDANGGKLVGNQTITVSAEGVNGTVPKAEKTDSTFKYWSLEKTGTKVEIKFDSFSDNTTVYAIWEAKQQEDPPTNDEYKITFAAGEHGKLTGETEVETKNGKATFPTVTPDDGWKFDKWTDAAGKTVDENTVFTAIATVTAQYTEVRHEEQDKEYTITFDGGAHGDIVGDDEVTTVKGKATFPTVSPEQGYKFDYWQDDEGNEVDEDWIFTANTTVTAQYTEDEGGDEEEDNVDPNPPARVHTTATINDEEMDDTSDTIDRTWAEYPDWQGYQNHTLADQFETSFVIEEETTYTFKADGTALSGVWMEHGDGLQFKIDDVLKAKGNGTRLTLAPGSYSIYLKYYNDNGGSWNIWVAGSQDEEFGGGGEERPTEDPEPPAREYTSATINDEAMEDVTDTIDRTWAEYDDWQGYQNHTLADQFKAVIDIDEVTTYTFKANGTALSGMWIEFAKGLELKIDGAIATGNKNGTSVTLAGGTYTIYLKKYANGGTNIWIEGTKTGEWGGGGGGEVVETYTYKVGENGTATNLTAKQLTTSEEGEGMTAQWWIDNGVFQTGDKLYFNIKGADITFEVETASSGVYTGQNKSYLEIKNGGTFKIYIKQYGTTYKVYAGREISADDDVRNADTVTTNGVYLVGKVDNSDATWSNWESKGFALTKRTDGKYEIIIDMADGDDFKFIKTPASGAISGSSVTWIGSLITENVEDYIGLAGENLSIKADGKFYFIVDVSKGEVYVSYSADGEPTAPSTEAPVYECFLRGEWDGATDWGKGWGMTKQADGSYQKKFVVNNKLTFKVYIEDGDGQAWKNAVDPNSAIKPSGSDNLVLNAGTYIIIWKDGKISVKAA